MGWISTFRARLLSEQVWTLALVLALLCAQDCISGCYLQNISFEHIYSGRAWLAYAGDGVPLHEISPHTPMLVDNNGRRGDADLLLLPPLPIFCLYLRQHCSSPFLNILLLPSKMHQRGMLPLPQAPPSSRAVFA